MQDASSKQKNKTKIQIISSADKSTTSLSLAHQKKTKQNKQTNKQTKTLSTNLTLYKAYRNHCANLTRAEIKRKKEFNLEAREKEISNTVSLKKNNENADKYCTNEGTN